MRPGIGSALARVAFGVMVTSVSLSIVEGRGEQSERVARQQIQGRSTADDGDVEVLQLRPNFYMTAGAGGNIGVQVGIDGVVVVDAGSTAKADAVVAAIKRITARPIRYVINTSADPDHVGGNETIAKAGQTLFTQSGDFLGG